MFSIASYKFCIIYANNMRKILRGGCTYGATLSINKPNHKKGDYTDLSYIRRNA